MPVFGFRNALHSRKMETSEKADFKAKSTDEQTLERLKVKADNNSDIGVRADNRQARIDKLEAKIAQRKQAELQATQTPQTPSSSSIRTEPKQDEVQFSRRSSSSPTANSAGFRSKGEQIEWNSLSPADQKARFDAGNAPPGLQTQYTNSSMTNSSAHTYESSANTSVSSTSPKPWYHFGIGSNKTDKYNADRIADMEKRTNQPRTYDSRTPSMSSEESYRARFIDRSPEDRALDKSVGISHSPHDRFGANYDGSNPIGWAGT